MFKRALSAIVTFFFVCMFVVTSSVFAEDSSLRGDASDPCLSAVPMDLGSSLRGYADFGESFFFWIEVPSAGIVSVDAAAPGIVGEAVLGLESRTCDTARQPVPLILERSSGHLILAAGAPGSYLFRVASEDPRRPLRELKVGSAFIAAGDAPNRYGEDEEEIEIDGFATPTGRYGEDEEEIEIDGFATPQGRYGEDEEEIEIDGFAGPTAGYGEDEEEIEIDGFAGPTAGYGEDEEEIEIDGFAAPGQGRSLIDRLCAQGDVDDHGDSLTCASRLIPGRALAGELGAGWGGDADTFSFVLGGSPGADLWSVVIETSGAVDTVGRLYDQTGQRLDVAAVGGLGDNFRIARTLRPGVYYVRVEGRDGAGGSYRLRVDASP